MKKILSAFLLSLLLVSSGIAQLPSSESSQQAQLQTALDLYLKKYQHDENISGITLTANGPHLEKPISVYAGFTDFSFTKKMTADNLNQMGSITKSFIAATLLQLEAQPNLHFSINDKLGRYLPQYPKWGNVRIKQLLNMTSGIPNYTCDNQFLLDLVRLPSRYIKSSELIAYVYNKPVLFNPGENFAYSNTNYILAGMIISKLSGHTVAYEIQQRFLRAGNPAHLHLTHTYYVAHFPSAFVRNKMVHGYLYNHDLANYIRLNTDVTNFSLSWAGCAGAIVSDSADISAWIEALLTPNIILQPQQHAELQSLVSIKNGQPLHTPNKHDPMGYGLGIYKGFIIPTLPLSILHEGLTLGARALYVNIPHEKIMLAITLNSDVEDGNNHMREIIQNAYQIMKHTPIKNIK